MLGGSCTAWFQDGHCPVAVELRGDEDNSTSTKKRSPFSADFFGSVCYSFQHGKFRELYGDLTRIDARLDICSASALAKRVINGLKSSSANSARDPMSSPRINLIFQQQVFLFTPIISVHNWVNFVFLIIKCIWRHLTNSY